MPGPGREVFDQLWTVMTEPIFKGIMEAIFEWGREPRPAKLRDESIGQFFERRLGGPDLPDNILSAVLHGIYSGDVHRLSMKTLLPLLWHAEQEYGSVTAYVRQILGRKATLTRADMMAGCKIPVEDNVSGIKRNASVYSFKGGIQTLSDALWNALEEMGVTIKTDYPVQSIKYDGTKGGKAGVISVSNRCFRILVQYC
jgi:oxygen-dependent protoporphyrinogen oxidase